MILTVLGASVGGASGEGCEALVNQVKQWGGKEEAIILNHGGRVRAYNAALVNSTMAPALDFCDFMIYGMHVGSSSVPTVMATAYLVGGCSWKKS